MMGLLVAIAMLGGCTGDDGPQGDDGVVGPPGDTPIVRFVQEPPGSHCEDGGIAIVTGNDADGDGRLSDVEVNDYEYVCDGDSPLAGPSVVVATSVEPSGSNCSAGGTALSYGLDLDDDGKLDAGEVFSTSYLCDGEDGMDGRDGAPGEDGDPVVFEVVDEPMGLNCMSGGRLWTFGLDIDGDGTLATNEVDGQFFVCDDTARRPVRLLDTRIGGWLDLNRAAINQLIAKHGSASDSYDPTRRPVAVFGWDGTVIASDTTDILVAWLIRESLVLQPPQREWSSINADLSATALEALSSACDHLAEPGEALPTGQDVGSECGAELLSIYKLGHTTYGTQAWSHPISYLSDQRFVWGSQLAAGIPLTSLRTHAERASVEAACGPEVRSLYDIELVGHSVVYPQMRDLMDTLRANGFVVWVVSSAPQWMVEAVAEELRITVDGVIGARALVLDGALSASFQQCGTSTNEEDVVLPFYEGKRRWLDQTVFGVVGPEGNEDESLRPVLAVGDSLGDVVMLQSATQLQLVIDHHQPELMCHALHNASETWFVQPPFDGSQSAPQTYDCPEIADPEGVRIVDVDGLPIPPQTY